MPADPSKRVIIRNQAAQQPMLGGGGLPGRNGAPRRHDVQIEHALSGLHAAACGRLDWPSALGAVARVLDLWVVQVLGVDKRNGQLMFSSHGGQAPPQTSLDYFRHYNTIDPRIPLGMATPVEAWMHCHEHLDEAFVAASPFYQDFLLPHGGRYVSATKLIDDTELQFILAFMRGRGSAPIGADELPLLARFKHHFTEAFRSLLHVRDQQAELTMARELLGPFETPMLLVDELGSLWHRNAAAERLLAAGDRVAEQGGYLVCRHRPAQRALAEALHALQLAMPPAAAGLPGEAPRRRALTLSATGQPRLLAFVSAVHPQLAMGAFGRAPRALVILHDADDAARRSGLDALVVGECFGLTPAESQVAVQLAGGRAPKEIAQASGCAITTVRSHLARVMEKTGARRQAELVQLLLALPVRG